VILQLFPKGDGSSTPLQLTPVGVNGTASNDSVAHHPTVTGAVRPWECRIVGPISLANRSVSRV